MTTPADELTLKNLLQHRAAAMPDCAKCGAQAYWLHAWDCPTFQQLPTPTMDDYRPFTVRPWWQLW